MLRCLVMNLSCLSMESLECAFHATPIEVLQCFKQLRAENERLIMQLKTQRLCPVCHSNAQANCLPFDTEPRHKSLSLSECCQQKHGEILKCDSNSLPLQELLDLCSSQAEEIGKIRRIADHAKSRIALLEQNLALKNFELQRALEFARQTACQSTSLVKIAKGSPQQGKPINPIFLNSPLDQVSSFDAAPLRRSVAFADQSTPDVRTRSSPQAQVPSEDGTGSEFGGPGRGPRESDLRETLLRCETALVRTRARLAAEHQVLAKLWAFRRIWWLADILCKRGVAGAGWEASVGWSQWTRAGLQRTSGRAAGPPRRRPPASARSWPASAAPARLPPPPQAPPSQPPAAAAAHGPEAGSLRGLGYGARIFLVFKWPAQAWCGQAGAPRPAACLVNLQHRRLAARPLAWSALSAGAEGLASSPTGPQLGLWLGFDFGGR